MASTVEDHYEQFLAARYTWMSGGHALQVKRSRQALTELGLAARAAGKALDLGCGSGYQSLALAELGYSVIAVDTSRQLLDELNSMADGERIAVVQGDMLRPETYQSHAPFDCVVCMGDTLLHVSSGGQVLQLFENIFRHTRPGGKLVLSFRDLSTELKGIDRLIPVRLDESGLMATFLEYTESHVNVHDMLLTQDGGEWRMTKSAYQKLRLSGDEAVTMLAQAGFTQVNKTVDRGFTTIAAERDDKMRKRREFLRSTIIGGLSWCALPGAVGRVQGAADPGGKSFDLQRDTPTRLYDGERCWCHPRAGIVPHAGANGAPRVVMTMNTLDVSGSDVFKSMHGMHTDDLGRSWTPPRPLPQLAVREEIIQGEKRPVAVSDFWPRWHAASGKLLGTGHTVVYTADWKVKNPRPRHTAYAVYDGDRGQWQAWRKLPMPEEDKFRDAGAGCAQRYDLPDGSLLLPFYFRPPRKNSRVAVARCAFDGRTLRYIEHGNELRVDDPTRGLHEPSLTRFQDQYFLTLRNDLRGYVTRSKDGLHFDPIQPWRFDDGSELGSYNTQQHWVTHSEGLFLVYTRRGAENDHVFRHRAPLFIAQVDPERLRVLRATERVLVPERGARLGNFGVTDVSPRETWITVAEWMQTWGPNHILPVDNPHGSDGSVWVARIAWQRPNASAR